MIITYQGAEFFKVQFGDTVLAFNPVSKESKLPQTRFGADVALVTTNHPDFNGVENVGHGERMPFAITGPGEYETKGVFITGFLSESKYGGLPAGQAGETRVNTVYQVALEGMNLCFLGALSSKELKSDTVEALDEIDVLFVPIGGDGVLDASAAYKLAVELEPKLIIPMHYGSVGGKDALKAFLKEGGDSPAPIEKLTLKKKDLEGKEGDIVVLEPIS
jgi:L-ascorbate metabolism protein UlaG (beta-lactamase superfamily)